MDDVAGKIKYYLFVILIFSFSFGEIFRISIFNARQINLMELFAFLFVFFSFAAGRVKIRNSKLATSIFIFLSFLIISLAVNISTLTSNQLFIAFLYLARWAMFAGVYFAVLEFDKETKEKIPFIMLISGALILAGGLFQYLFYPDLRNLYYLGWDEHLYRLFSSFLDPNFTGAFLVLFFLFLFNYFLKSKNLFLGFFGVLNLIAIFLTYSRSAYLMFFVGILTFIFIKREKKFLVGILSIFMIMLLLASFMGLKSEGTNLLRINSSQARLVSSQEALDVFRQNPVFGVGFNAYEYAIEKKHSNPTVNYNHAQAGTDNSSLFILATAGVLGLIAYLYFWSSVFALNKKSFFWPVLVSSSIALFVNSIFINSLFYSFIMFWMWVIISLCEE